MIHNDMEFSDVACAHCTAVTVLNQSINSISGNRQCYMCGPLKTFNVSHIFRYLE